MEQTIIIGIAGPSGSGKTLLANTIVNELGTEQVAVISEDSYYKDNAHLTFEEREKINYDHPDSMDHELLAKHLQQLRNGQSVDIPVYDFKTHRRSTETRHISKHAITVLEGILLFTDPVLRDQMNTKIFMDTPLDICLIRRLRRDMLERQRSFESIVSQYEATVRPMYFRYVEPSKCFSDIIVPRGGENRIAIEMIKAKMRELLLRAHKNEVL